MTSNTTTTTTATIPITATMHHHPPTIRFFASRPNGTLTPLIPADELPLYMQLHGVPRLLTLEATAGMQHVGQIAWTGSTYDTIVSQPEETKHALPSPASSTTPATPCNVTAHKFLAPDAQARKILGLAQVNEHSPHRQPLNLPSDSSPLPSKTSPDPSNKAQSIINAILATPTGALEAARINHTSSYSNSQAGVAHQPSPFTPPPSGITPNQDKKEFCTYWIRHGACDYMQQGCLYKHEMPDRATLAKIGIRGVPRWYAESKAFVKVGGREGSEEGLGMVRPVVRSEVWLKRGMGQVVKGGSSSSDDGSDSDAGSEKADSVVDASAGKAGRSSGSESGVPAKSDRPAKVASAATKDSNESIKAGETDQPSTPIESLIDFDAPLSSPLNLTKIATAKKDEARKSKLATTPRQPTSKDHQSRFKSLVRKGNTGGPQLVAVK